MGFKPVLCFKPVYTVLPIKWYPNHKATSVDKNYYDIFLFKFPFEYVMPNSNNFQKIDIQIICQCIILI